jgi:hypothetical protein
MPVATVEDRSLRFSYEDSGPLGGSYTTLVMVHGTGFHSGKSLCPSGNQKKKRAFFVAQMDKYMMMKNRDF